MGLIFFLLEKFYTKSRNILLKIYKQIKTNTITQFYTFFCDKISFFFAINSIKEKTFFPMTLSKNLVPITSKILKLQK